MPGEEEEDARRRAGILEQQDVLGSSRSNLKRVSPSSSDRHDYTS